MYTPNIIGKTENSNSSSFWVPVFGVMFALCKSYTADL